MYGIDIRRYRFLIPAYSETPENVKERKYKKEGVKKKKIEAIEINLSFSF